MIKISLEYKLYSAGTKYQLRNEIYLYTIRLWDSYSSVSVCRCKHHKVPTTFFICIYTQFTTWDINIFTLGFYGGSNFRFFRILCISSCAFLLCTFPNIDWKTKCLVSFIWFLCCHKSKELYELKIMGNWDIYQRQRPSSTAELNWRKFCNFLDSSVSFHSLISSSVKLGSLLVLAWALPQI